MIDDSTAMERRITLRLLAYWEKRRGARRMPMEADIDPADIADLWESCFLAHTRDIGKPGYRFTYLGKTIADIYHEGLETGAENVFPNIDELANGYKQVLASAEPLIVEGEITTPHGDVFKYRQALLPLGEGRRVDAIFGGTRFLRVVAYK
jgi:hypothetical protein